MHRSCSSGPGPEPAPSLARRRPGTEPGPLAQAMGRPQSRGKALCHRALRLASRASAGAEVARAGPGDRKSIPSSGMEWERDPRGEGKRAVRGCCPGGVPGGQCWRGPGPREGETGVKFLLQLEMALGERTCQWSGKPGEEPERASARRPHPPRLSPCSELYSARHTSFP